MSKRFGRNQKRKLLAKLSEAETAMALQRNIIPTYTGRLREVENRLQWLRDALPRFFALLPPEVVSMPHEARAMEHIRLAMRDRFRSFGLPDQPEMEFVGLVNHFVDLPIVQEAIRKHDGPYGRWFHCEVKYSDSLSRYAFDPVLVHQVGAELVTNQLSRTLARALVEQIRACGKGTR